MIAELRPQDFNTVAPLFEGFDHDRTYIDAVLHGLDGRVLTDPELLPGCAIACHHSGLWLIGGNTDPALVGKALEAIVLRHGRRPPFDYLSVAKQSDVVALHAELGNSVALAHRVSHSIPASALEHTRNWHCMVPRGYAVRRMDYRLVRDVQRQIGGDFTTYWPDSAEFIQRSIGYCVVRGRRIVSIAWSAFPLSESMELVTETVPKFCGHGFASLACLALMESCYDNHIVPLWNTDLGNSASLRLAQKLGFSETTRFCWLQHTPWNSARRSISLDSELLDVFTGVYAIDRVWLLILTRRADALYVQFADRGLHSDKWEEPQQLVAESETCFFLERCDFQLCFGRAPDGKIEALTVYRGGRPSSAKLLR